MASKDVRHFVGEDEGDGVWIEIAEVEEGAGDEDEAAGEGEGVGIGVVEAANLESAFLIDESFCEALGERGQPAANFGVIFQRSILDMKRGEIAAHTVFRLNFLGLGAGD